MKILLCHTKYQVSGGEDQSFVAEAELLEHHNHEVIRLVRHNAEIEQMSRVAIAGRTIWNRAAYAEVRRIIHRTRPDLVHCTNLFPLLSPSVYYAARAERTPVVQSLRNYRLSCLNSFLFREGTVCESCLGRTIAWPGVWRACYRNSRAGSAVVATMLGMHRAAGTWRRMVDLYFTTSEFARRKLVSAGVPAEKLVVKPNFVYPDPGVGPGRGGFALFVGRLSPEKGVRELLDAWRLVGPSLPLRLVGDGPLRETVARAAADRPEIEWTGHLAPADVLETMGRATVLLMPSQWHETFGRTIVEAFAKGTPVIASKLGAMAELVEHGRTGLLVEPGDVTGLAGAAQRLAQDRVSVARMRRAARAAFEASYTASRNYEMLMSIYARALAQGRLQQEPGGRDLEESA